LALGTLVAPRIGVDAAAQRPADLATPTLVEVSDLLRRRLVSPVDVTTACLQRIERLNPTLPTSLEMSRGSNRAAA
jgi:Asp-tRNA(Asn)/Glu-tRNA(Gln) amidotransferase A subunit family amidase